MSDLLIIFSVFCFLSHTLILDQVWRHRCDRLDLCCAGRGPSAEDDQTQQYAGGSEQQRQAPERNAESLRQGPIVRHRPRAYEGEIRVHTMCRPRTFKAMAPEFLSIRWLS